MLAVGDPAHRHAAPVANLGIGVDTVFLARKRVARGVEPDRAFKVPAIKILQLLSIWPNAVRKRDAMDEAERRPRMVVAENASRARRIAAAILKLVYGETDAGTQLVGDFFVKQAVGEKAAVVFDVAADLIV